MHAHHPGSIKVNQMIHLLSFKSIQLFKFGIGIKYLELLIKCKVGFVAELVIWCNISDQCFYIERSTLAKL